MGLIDALAQFGLDWLHRLRNGDVKACRGQAHTTQKFDNCRCRPALAIGERDGVCFPQQVAASLDYLRD